VVSDGALAYLPFSALPEPRTAAPLAVQHEIVSLPSASILAVQRRALAARKPAPKALAVLADPVFDRADERLATASRAPAAALEPGESREVLRSAVESGLTEAGTPIPRLPYTRREADDILALVPPAESLRALDFDASHATATAAALGQYRYVHFATHGLLNSQHPELSGIVLSLVDANGGEQNGFLRLNEIFNLRLPAEMVVLSGCRTGLGKEIRGEGLVGLTQGFLYAGAARVLVSLWDVSDRASAELMVQLYREMLGHGLSPAAALRAAQLRARKQERWQAPYYWAAFVLQGEPR
jgi:CHAT domain-containing protein